METGTSALICTIEGLKQDLPPCVNDRFTFVDTRPEEALEVAAVAECVAKVTDALKRNAWDAVFKAPMRARDLRLDPLSTMAYSVGSLALIAESFQRLAPTIHQAWNQRKAPGTASACRVGFRVITTWASPGGSGAVDSGLAEIGAGLLYLFARRELRAAKNSRSARVWDHFRWIDALAVASGRADLAEAVLEQLIVAHPDRWALPNVAEEEFPAYYASIKGRHPNIGARRHPHWG